MYFPDFAKPQPTHSQHIISWHLTKSACKVTALHLNLKRDLNIFALVLKMATSTYNAVYLQFTPTYSQ